MDKYEYKLKTEQMLELMEDGAYRKAAEIADTIDWRRVRNVSMLTQVSDIYEKNKEYRHHHFIHFLNPLADSHEHNCKSEQKPQEVPAYTSKINCKFPKDISKTIPPQQSSQLQFPEIREPESFQ